MNVLLKHFETYFGKDEFDHHFQTIIQNTDNSDFIIEILRLRPHLIPTVKHKIVNNSYILISVIKYIDNKCNEIEEFLMSLNSSELYNIRYEIKHRYTYNNQTIYSNYPILEYNSPYKNEVKLLSDEYHKLHNRLTQLYDNFNNKYYTFNDLNNFEIQLSEFGCKIYSINLYCVNYWYNSLLGRLNRLKQEFNIPIRNSKRLLESQVVNCDKELKAC